LYTTKATQWISVSFLALHDLLLSIAKLHDDFWASGNEQSGTKNEAGSLEIQLTSQLLVQRTGASLLFL
jgi:hypothetical protein